MPKKSKINSQVNELREQIKLSKIKLKALKERQNIFKRAIKKVQKGLKEKLDGLTYIVDTKQAKKEEQISEDLRDHIETMLSMLEDNIVDEEKGGTSLHLPGAKKRVEKTKNNLTKKIGIEKLNEICQIKEEVVKLEIDKKKIEKEINQEDKIFKMIKDSSLGLDSEQEDKEALQEESASKKRKKGYTFDNHSRAKLIRAESQKQKDKVTKVGQKEISHFSQRKFELGRKMTQSRKMRIDLPTSRPIRTDNMTQSAERPNLEHIIGKGGYGKVYYGKWKLQDVAVKELYMSSKNILQDDIKEILNEINILKDLRNRYIIQYYGTYFDDQELLIIMDYAENGSLTKHINDNKDKEHDWNFNSELIKQITLGLAYIHYQNIIHRDLKSMNILLNKHFQVKISDFGLSKTKNISSSQSSHGIVGTLRWMAPELLRETNHPQYSEQSDIYALGMVIWELTAQCTQPFKDIDYNLVAFHIVDGKKEEIPSNAPKNIQNIIQQCWKDNPDERIVLEKILKKIGSDKPSFQITSNDEKLLEPQNNKEIKEKHEDTTDMSLDINDLNLNQAQILFEK